MSLDNKYFKIAIVGAALTLIAQLVLFLTVDPYIPAVLSPVYSVWVILFVVGWRKKYPRR